MNFNNVKGHTNWVNNNILHRKIEIITKDGIRDDIDIVERKLLKNVHIGKGKSVKTYECKFSTQNILSYINLKLKS